MNEKLLLAFNPLRSYPLDIDGRYFVNVDIGPYLDRHCFGVAWGEGYRKRDDVDGVNADSCDVGLDFGDGESW